jgi:hypothetical protein
MGELHLANVKADLTELNRLMKMLKTNYTLRVGIIGNKATAEHNDDGLTNAELGTFHEFGGTSKNGKEQPPRRSFLEDPLKLKLNFNNADMKPFKKVLWKQFFVKKAPEQFYNELGAKALEVIEGAFASNGYGMWKSLSMPLFSKRWDLADKAYGRLEKQMLSGKIPYDLARLNNALEEIKNPQILTETGALRHSISFKVIKK